MINVVLASASPRRRALLEQAGIEHTVVTSSCDEGFDPSLTPEEAVKLLSCRKAKTVAEKLSYDCVVIGSDTVVSLDNKILGKPKDEKQAEEMLLSLSGRVHKVYTGVTFVHRQNENIEYTTISDCTSVFFRKLDVDEIKRYIATGEPMDKAGAYGIQEKGAVLVEKTEGDFYTVVGLPIVKVYEYLKKFEQVL